METFSYLAWQFKDSPYMKGQSLLSQNQISAVLNSLMKSPKRQAIYKTIQEYDKDCNVIYTPIYADFDGPTALDDVNYVVDQFKENFGIYPEIYFSGSKGFHLIINSPFDYFRTDHLINKKLFESFGPLESLDLNVYTSRRLFRLENSVHLKTNLFKIRLEPYELELEIDEIKELAKKQRTYRGPIEKYESKTLLMLIDSIRHEVDRNDYETNSYERIINENKPHCIQKLIETRPKNGSWNPIITLIARYYNSQEIELDVGVNELLEYEHWKSDEQHVRKVFRSVFRCSSRFGCKDNKTLEQYCSIWCEFNGENICLL